ncbi:alpha/beta hydrolase, partial [Pseudomonas aeruginosa]|uniref:alpha/beta fold hydrolase n=1 Tax=Pseudomonas aeruginosa TaxID=287 RepID=UPI002B406F1B
VISVEPLGTGLSDQADTPRTADNIAREVHSALQRLGVERYVLMGHSIAGIYALHYSTLYPEELVAFVGIDSSVPGQPG